MVPSEPMDIFALCPLGVSCLQSKWTDPHWASTRWPLEYCTAVRPNLAGSHGRTGLLPNTSAAVNNSMRKYVVPIKHSIKHKCLFHQSLVIIKLFNNWTNWTQLFHESLVFNLFMSILESRRGKFNTWNPYLKQCTIQITKRILPLAEITSVPRIPATTVR